MSKFFFTGIIRSLIHGACLFGASVCLLPETAFAAQWQWSRISGRERVTVILDNPVQKTEVARNDTHAISITFDPPAAALSSQGTPDAQDLISGATLENGQLVLHTNSAAFGFIATRPAGDRIVLDVFSDPLGARWRPEGGVAPAAAVAAAGTSPLDTATMQPASPAPATTTTPQTATTETAPIPLATDEGNPPAEETTRQAVPAVTSASTAEAPASLVIPPVSGAPASSPSAAAAAGSPARPTHTPDSTLPDVQPDTATPITTAAQGNPPVAAAATAYASDRTVQSASTPPPSPSVGPVDASVPPATSVQGPSTATAATTTPPSAPIFTPSDVVVMSGADNPNQPPTVRSRLNTGGPDAWPAEKLLSSDPSLLPPGINSTPPISARDTTIINQGQPASRGGPRDGAATGLVPGPAAGRNNEADAGSSLSLDANQTTVNSAIDGVPTERAPTQSTTAVTAEPEAPAAAPAGDVETLPPSDINAAPEISEPASFGEPSAPETPESASPALAPIYKDEQGNIIPPPPDIPALLNNMQTNMRSGRYADALPIIETLMGVTLSQEEREDVLYNEMTALFEVNQADLQNNSESIIQAANAAMNFDHQSIRVPEAMSVLASVNLDLNNLEDAIGYINLMHRQFPGNPNVPVALLSLGEKQMNRQEYAEATISFQTILQDYPESKAAKDAARLQTYALYRQGHMERALTLLDFVDRRWPRIYLEDPDFLSMAADIQFRQGKLDEAVQTFWTQYNLNPVVPSTAVTLQRLGELYYVLGDTVAAGKVLEELTRAFPQSEEAPIALMRLGEGGLFQGNLSVDDMFALFAIPNPRLPGIYYQRVLQEYPRSPQAMPAQLRTIAWQLWNKEYMPAMDAARSFMIDYADKPESLRAQDILMRGFAHELANALSEENFERVLMLWGRYPQVHEYYQPLEQDLRMAMARAHLNRGDEARGLEFMASFLDGPGDTNYGFYTYNMFLNAYVRDSNWDGILTLGEKVANWNLPADSRIQLDYAMALAAENLGLISKALPLWQKLAPRENIPLYQRAYATYFLARESERRQDLRNAYQYNLDALGMFTQLADDQSPYADSERIRESIAALMDVTEIAGRYAESLDWASKYATFVPTDSPDYAGLRFREARLHRKMGDMTRWRSILQSIVNSEPDSVFGKMSASELHTQDVARDLTRFTQ